MNILEQKEVEVGGHKYLIQAMPFTYGMTVMDEMSEGALNPDRITDILKKSLTYRGKQFTNNDFEKHFSRRYKDVGELLGIILEFNYGAEMSEDGELLEGGSPLGESSLESEDTSEE